MWFLCERQNDIMKMSFIREKGKVLRFCPSAIFSLPVRPRGRAPPQRGPPPRAAPRCDVIFIGTLTDGAFQITLMEYDFLFFCLQEREAAETVPVGPSAGWSGANRKCYWLHMRRGASANVQLRVTV